MQSIKTNHLDNCSCIDCWEAQSSQKYNPAIQSVNSLSTRRGQGEANHASAALDDADPIDVNTETNPGYYIGSLLVAKKPVKIWSLPGASLGGVVKSTVPVGGTVGTIDSWVLDKKSPSFVWWILKDGKGYVLHETGLFDIQVAKDTSSGLATVTSKAKADAINLNPAPALEGILNLPYVKWVLIGIVVLIVGIVVLKLT